MPAGPFHTDAAPPEATSRPRPTHRPPARLRGWAGLYLAGLLVAAWGIWAPAPPQDSPLVRDGVAYVVPIGPVAAADVARAAWALRAQLHLPVQVLPAQSLPTARGPDGAAPVERILDDLLRTAPADAFRVLGVTQAPLTSAHLGALIGYARQGERALVYSTHSLPQRATEAAHRRRVTRVVAHELGHTYGAGHCDVACVMHGTETPTDVDLLADRYCPEHQALASKALALHLDHPDFLAGVGAEQLRLGQWQAAAEGYRQALHARPRDVRLRTSLGVALMADGQTTAAREAFEAGLVFDPTAPQPYYGLAVLYAAGVAPARAPAFLEAAVRRDGDPLRAHRAAGILYQDVLDDPLRAAWHYEAHVQKGGRDPEVIARLTYLISPAMLTFSQPEVVVARWTAEGLMVAQAHWQR